MRTTKKVSLTPDGQDFYEEVKRALSIIDVAQTRLIHKHNPLSGQITIGSTDTLCKHFLLDKLRLIIHERPHLKIKLVNATSLECLNLLSEAQIDLALINLPENMDEKFDVQKQYPFQDQFVTSKNNPIPSKLSLAQIADQPLLLLDDKSVTRRFLDQLFLHHHIKIEPEIELQNIDLLAEMVEIGLGTSFLPDLCLKQRNVKIIHTQEVIPARHFGIVALKDWLLSEAASYFIDTL